MRSTDGATAGARSVSGLVRAAIVSWTTAKTKWIKYMPGDPHQGDAVAQRTQPPA